MLHVKFIAVPVLFAECVSGVSGTSINIIKSHISPEHVLADHGEGTSMAGVV